MVSPDTVRILFDLCRGYSKIVTAIINYTDLLCIKDNYFNLYSSYTHISSLVKSQPYFKRVNNALLFTDCFTLKKDCSSESLSCECGMYSVINYFTENL